jgi:hypothetical protein
MGEYWETMDTKVCPHRSGRGACGDCYTQAAREVERLRAALRQVQTNMGRCESTDSPGGCEGNFPGSPDCWCPWCVAHAALKEKGKSK